MSAYAMHTVAPISASFKLLVTATRELLSAEKTKLLKFAHVNFAGSIAAVQNGSTATTSKDNMGRTAATSKYSTITARAVQRHRPRSTRDPPPALPPIVA